VDQGAQAADQVGGVALGGGIAHPTEDLDHALGGSAGEGREGVHHGQQAGAPRGDADHLAGLDGGLQIVGGGTAHFAQNLGLLVGVTIGHDSLAQAVARLQLLLQFGVGAGRHTDGDAHNALLLGTLSSREMVAWESPRAAAISGWRSPCWWYMRATRVIRRNSSMRAMAPPWHGSGL
jgi:hypothetical protein